MPTRKINLFSMFVSLTLVLSGCGPTHSIPPLPPLPNTPVLIAPALQTDFGHLPLLFTPNHSQTDDRVAYYIQGRDKTIYFTENGLTMSLPMPVESDPSLETQPDRELALDPHAQPVPTPQQRWTVKLDFVGARPNAKPMGQDQTETIVSYFKGQPDEWKTSLPTFTRLVYTDLWPGVDLVYAGTQDRLKYEFVVKPGADPRQIRLAYRGITALNVNAEGQLVVRTPAGEFLDEAPLVYQDIAGERVIVPAAYEVDRSGMIGAYTYGFELGEYDSSRPLVIDPVMLIYAGYIGGSGNDYGQGIAVDGLGNAYVTGYTYSDEMSFPEAGGPDLTHNGGYDVFVAKVNAAGTGLVYAGYIGGTGDEERGGSIAVDGMGNAYVSGLTDSTQTTFPVVGGPDLTYNGGNYDAFVAKVNATGTGLVYAGYIGGSGSDYGNGVAVDGAGNAYVAGYTDSTQTTFPVIGGPDLTYNGLGDAFVAKVNATGIALVYAGYIGGSSWDEGRAIVVDGTGNAYMTGGTGSTQTTFPEVGGPDLTYNGGYDTFVAKVNVTGTGLVYAGYIGGSGYEWGYGIALNGAGNAYVTGHTDSTQTTFPEVGGPDLTYNGATDAFVAKVTAAGTGLVYAGYIGGNAYDGGWGIAVDGEGNAYVTGGTSSYETTFPEVGGPDLTYNGATDAFVAKVNATGTGLVYAGYIGGSGSDYGNGVAVDREGNAYVTGGTSSYEITFPEVGGPDLTHNGGDDAFVAKVQDGVRYSISGLITDVNNNPIFGVTVSAGTNVSAITNASGFYTITNLITSTYTLTSTKGGYTFSPIARTVSVPPNATDQDFRGYDKPPLVFVHGWRGSPPQFVNCTDAKYEPTSLADAKDYFQGMGDTLKADGNYGDTEIFYAQLVSNQCYTPPLLDNVNNLTETIKLAKDSTGQPKIILITHSMGGLVSRAYIEGPDYEGDVAALFTFGSPHLGVPEEGLSGLLGLPGYLTFGAYCVTYQPAACDFSTTGMFVFNLGNHYRDSVTYHVVSGDAPMFTLIPYWRRTTAGLITGALIPGPDDGIIPTDSGKAIFLGTFDRFQTDEVHGTVFGSRAYFIRDGGQSTSYLQCLKKVLIDGEENCGTIGPFVPETPNTSELDQHTPIEYGILSSGQTVTRTISLENGPALFAAQWQTGTISMTLLSPSNQVIDSAFAATNPEVVSYTSDANAATYYFPSAEVGDWQLVLQTIIVPISGTSTSSFVAFDSAVALNSGTDKLWYTPGVNATITATLTGLPLTATVTASILRADSVTDTITLTPFGSGQYQALYTVPNAPGYAEVRLIATGTLSSSLSFERGTSLLIQISPNTFTHNGSYSDTPYPYPGFSLYQSLTVTVGINATISGTVGLSADLIDGNGNFVAHSFTIRDVTTGTTTLSLRFEGTDIYASQHNGSYTLTNLLITDQTGAALVTMEATNVYVTAPYQYTDFANPTFLYLPLVRQ